MVPFGLSAKSTTKPAMPIADRGLPHRQKMMRRKKNVKKGIQFCLMVCGASGTGSSADQSFRSDKFGP
jgi:hypothetical protein